MPHQFLREMTMLNELTSETMAYTPSQKHHIAFEEIKKCITTFPLFSNIINPSYKKILFVDSSDHGCYSGVLGQLQPAEPHTEHVPSYLVLDDPVDRIIFQN